MTNKLQKRIKELDSVKVIAGNNEFGQRTMINQIGVIKSFGTEYKVKGVETKEVYVEFENNELHVFNDYHLELIN